MSKTNRSYRALVIALFSAMLVFPPVPQRASATAVEYAVMLALIIVVAASVEAADLPDGSQVLVGQLEAAVEGAQAANLVGNSVAELIRVSKASGAAQALIGMTSACADCGELRDALQQLIGQAAARKTELVGVAATCHPNGIRTPNEECDPLAKPTGCVVNPIAVTYCSDECRCELAIAP